MPPPHPCKAATTPQVIKGQRCFASLANLDLHLRFHIHSADRVAATVCRSDALTYSSIHSYKTQNHIVPAHK